MKQRGSRGGMIMRNHLEGWPGLVNGSSSFGCLTKRWIQILEWVVFGVHRLTVMFNISGQEFSISVRLVFRPPRKRRGGGERRRDFETYKPHT